METPRIEKRIEESKEKLKETTETREKVEKLLKETVDTENHLVKRLEKLQSEIHIWISIEENFLKLSSQSQLEILEDLFSWTQDQENSNSTDSIDDGAMAKKEKELEKAIAITTTPAPPEDGGKRTPPTPTPQTSPPAAAPQKFQVGDRVQNQFGQTGVISQKKHEGEGILVTSSGIATEPATPIPGPSRDLPDINQAPSAAIQRNTAGAIAKTARNLPVFSPGERVWYNPLNVREGIVKEQLPSGLVLVHWEIGSQTPPIHPKSLYREPIQQTARDLSDWMGCV